MVDFITDICKYLPISDTTRHLAILLVDHFMEKHSIIDFKLKLVLLACLLLAAKLEDRDDHVPSIQHLKNLAKVNKIAEYSEECFLTMELCLMQLVNIVCACVCAHIGSYPSIFLFFQCHILYEPC